MPAILPPFKIPLVRPPHPTSPSATTLMRLSVRPAAVLLALATLATYANSLGGALVFDDIGSLVTNTTLRDWRTAFFPPGGGITVSGRPVLNASFALSHALGGGAPWGHHIVNVLVHTCAALALFGFVRRTLLLPSLRARYAASATLLAFCIALLWALHPLQTQAVTYLVQRAESQMGLFFLLACYAYVRGATASPSEGGELASPRAAPLSPTVWFTLSAAATLLSLGTKEVAVAIPLLILCHDRAFVAGTVAVALRSRRTFYLCLFATWIPLAALVLGTGGNRGGTSGFHLGLAPLDYWLTQFEALTRYLALSFWPHPLIFEYGTFFTTRFAAAAPYSLVVLPLIVATLWTLWRRPSLGFIGLWFFAILAPTSLMPGTLQMIVEHRLYLSLAAILTLIVLAAHARLPRFTLPLFSTLALTCAILTAARNLDYRSDLALWSGTVAHRPDNARAHLYLANALALAGRPAEAIGHYETAHRLAPADAEAPANLSLALSNLGRLTEAIAAAEAALRLNPGFATAHLNLALALLHAGRPTDAVPHLETALALSPSLADAHNSLGVALIQLGRAPEAAAHFESALRLRPDYASARDNLARLRTLLRSPSP